MCITMCTALYGYICYEFLGLNQGLQCVPCNLAATPYNWRRQVPQHPGSVWVLWSLSPPGPRRATPPTRPIPDPLFAGSILKWVTLEF